MNTPQDNKALESILNNPNALDKTELGEVSKEFGENKPSSSNLTPDEFRLAWRSKSILQRLSPKSEKIIDSFIDMKRSVQGWNTEKKVEAITGVHKQRQGMFSKISDALFKPKQPGGQ